MSKKARDLMESMTPIITRGLCGFNNAPEADAKLEALIDDFARKVLERAAERFRKKYFSLVATEEYEDDEIADMWNLYITEHCCSAILSPEEN